MLKFCVNSIIIYLITILLQFKCQVLGQNIVYCNLDNAANVPNICNSQYAIHVRELSDCGSQFNKCWCIIVDNSSGQYDGTMVIELSQVVYPGDFQSQSSHEYFMIVPGVNRVIYPAASNAIDTIQSIKIRNVEICKVQNTNYRVPIVQRGPTIQIPRNEVAISQRRPSFTTITSKPKNDLNLEQILYEDCARRNVYTINSSQYCPNQRPEFLIEKRFVYNNLYWCININNDNFIFTSTNRLNIAYSNHQRHVNWAPQNAHLESRVFGGEFHLGNQRTIIIIWQDNNEELANVNSITIDRRPICNYFGSIESRDPIRPITIDQNCGIKKNVLNPLISFGQPTRPGDWPWHAAIHKLETAKHRYFICGGTLIDRKTIITAAHCVYESNSVVIPNRLIVELGRYDLAMRSDWTKEYRVFDVIPHEGYDQDKYQNDIAIIILANYVDLTTDYVNFVCLPNQNAKLDNMVGTAVGWGLDENNNMLTELKEAALPVVDQVQCLSSNRGFFQKYLTNSNFCAGHMNNTSVCRGDSGGGLFFNSENNWFLGGITSFGVASKSTDHACDLKQYVIFTDVSKFLPWINRNI